STVSIASRTTGFGIGTTDWYNVGGCESGTIAPRPDGNVVYAGCYDGYIGRYDTRTREERDVTVYPENPMGWGAEGMKYRFQWTFPIVLSPHDPNTLYAAGNVLFRSTNEGQSWEAISPDLTRNDKTKLGSSGGPITQDNSSVEYYCTIFAAAESPLEKGVIWAGSDDGLVHVTRDGGKRWEDVTPRELPPWSMISQIDPSPTTPGTAYLAANHYKQDDDRPLAFVTTDYGKRWRRITNGLPASAFVRVVREDPKKKGLLYCGTETGIYFSPDDGGRWWPLRLNAPGAGDAEKATLVRAHARAVPADAGRTLAEEEPRGLLPVVPVTDLVVKGHDLVVSTQGRAFWILDDVSPLRQLEPTVTSGPAHLFKPAPAPLFGGPVAGGPGQNPPRGVLFYYWLANDPGEKDEVTLEILDPAGKLLRKLSSKGEEGAEGGEGPGGEGEEFGRGPAPVKLPARAGLNRFAWNFRYPDATRFKGLIMWGGSTAGPEVIPGQYQARLTAGGTTQTVAFEVKPDPRLTLTQADYQKRFDLLLEIHDKLSETHQAILRIRDVRDQVKAVAERSKGLSPDTTIAAAARVLSDKLTKVEEALYQTKNASGEDPLNFPIRLNNKLAALAGVVESAAAPPTDQSVLVYQDVRGRIDAELGKLRALISGDLAAFNQLVRDRNVPAVIVKEKKERAAGGVGGTP
ncbi:MAG TPA: glycosyl hydrolase, partial [Candidatus Eisenbacteria bacterium]